MKSQEIEKIPSILREDEIIDKAFGRAKKVAKEMYSEGSEKIVVQRKMITITSDIISKTLTSSVKKYPSFDNLPKFYRELIDLSIGIDKLKVSLGRVHGVSKRIKKLSREYITRMKDERDSVNIRKQFYGRSASMVKKISKDLIFLNEAREKIRKFPKIDFDCPLIVVSGYPNVGKSCIVNLISSGRPDIANYPFTTKSISVGHFTHGRRRYQVADIPGILDRPLQKRNEMEKVAILAIKDLADVILHVLDPTETCGYPMGKQLNLLEEVRNTFSLPVLVVANKLDIKKVESDIFDISISAKTGERLEEMTERLINLVDGDGDLGGL